MELGQIQNELTSLENELLKLDKYLLATGKSDRDNNTVILELHKLKKRSLEVGFRLDIYEDSRKRKAPEERQRLVDMRKKIELLDNYNSMLVQYKQKNSLNLIALVSLIFLPLTLITGYFGMNFRYMGGPLKRRGVFGIKDPNIFVMVLFAVAIVVMVVVVRFKKM